MKPKSAAILKKCRAVLLVSCLRLSIGGGTAAVTAEEDAQEMAEEDTASEGFFTKLMDLFR